MCAAGTVNLGMERLSSSAPTRDSNLSGRMTAGAESSGAAASTDAASSTPSQKDVTPRSRARSCNDARAGLAYYRVVVEHWAGKMGRETRAVRGAGGRLSCPAARRAAKFWHRKAREWRLRYEAWARARRDEWNWHAWLPAKWQRIARCETGGHGGSGPGGSVWSWNSGSYQGAFGFANSTWDQYKPAGAPSEAYYATPREQYECALNVYSRFGYGAWGCGGA